jgi:DNA-binding LytR/AlgR family response regulator
MEQHIHLFLVDIILSPDDPGDVYGLEFAQGIRGIMRYQFTPLIFITSLEDPTFCSYTQLHCFSYIEKPFDPENVQKIIQKALKFPIVDDNERFVYFRKDGIIYSKCVKDVIYIEIARRKIVIHCKDDVLEIPYKTCEEIMRELDSTAFVRCSRYGIINRNYIEEIDYTNRYIKMKYIKEPVEIGIIMKSKFKRMVEEKK